MPMIRSFAAACGMVVAYAAAGGRASAPSKETYALAVIGDTPYGAAKLKEFPDLVALVNTDSSVDVVVHLGDIKAGTHSPCTDEYNATIRGLFDTFAQPVVYTPGDNEWTDCHADIKDNGLYTPTERLQAVRKAFFPVPGQTLGRRKVQLQTQASDSANSGYVENTMWVASGVVFAALNIPGSDNDLEPWGTKLPANAGAYPSQSAERAARARANRAWIARAFKTAEAQDAAGVVLMFQADMWDKKEELSGYDALVIQIGTLAAAFKKPVLLLEGDSHYYRVDHPYAVTSPLHFVHPETPKAEKVTRLVVNGDQNRTEYVRVTIHPQGSDLFTFERVPLHAD